MNKGILKNSYIKLFIRKIQVRIRIPEPSKAQRFLQRNLSGEDSDNWSLGYMYRVR